MGGGDRAVWLHAVPVRHPSPRIRACTHATVHVEGVRGAAKQRFRACESSRQVATAATTAFLPIPGEGPTTHHWGVGPDGVVC